MLLVDAEKIEAHLDYSQLIKALEVAFQNDYQIPQREHYSYQPKDGADPSTIFLMPAWDDGKDLGVKLITVSPENQLQGLPTIQGVYILFDQPSGAPKAFLDAEKLTVKRTAATSALASSFLSRGSSKSMLMIGTGALAPELIRAHAEVRPIEKVFVWGRSFIKAEKISRKFSEVNYSVEPVTSFDKVIGLVDIISCATLSNTPLIFGHSLVEGQHVDLVGSFKPDMREADDTLAGKVRWFVDSYKGATSESGDLAIPLKKGIIKIEDIHADLFELCGGSRKGRTAESEITCFKSVGHALEDLVAASLVIDQLKND
ncbi:MAG: ornithine cyclodeaminase family protein [Cyclobacteriaceae bacterium]